MSDLSGFKVFEPLFTTFSFKKSVDEPQWDSILVAEPLQVATAPNEPILEDSEIRLWFDQQKVPGIDALSRKLGAWLESKGIPSNAIVVESTLAILATGSKHGRSLVQSLGILESSIRTADVSHFAMLNTNLPSSWKTSLEWKGFEIGQLNLSKLESRCSRAGSPLDKGTRQYLKTLPTISSPIYKRNVFDLDIVLEGISSNDFPASPARLAYEWYRAVQVEHWHEMWSDFEERRALIYALGFGLVNGDTYKNSPSQTRISCYLNLRDKPKNEGYAVFGQPIHRIKLPDLGESKSGISQIESICNLDEVERSSLAQIISAYTMTLCRGNRIALEGHSSESYLHYIIALEQLFSSRDNTAQTVAGRTAVLVHRQLGLKFSDCRKDLLREHYEARSRFVHSAKPIPHNLIEPIHHITQAILRSLLWLAKGVESRSPDFFDTWVKRLDWIIAGFEAGIQPPDEVLDANGIITTDALPLP